MALALTLLTIGCSSGGGSGSPDGGGGTGGGGGGASAAIYDPCPPAMRVGGFSVDLTAMEGEPGYTTVTGGVRNAVDPRQVWTGATNAPGCALVTGPTLTCATACVSPMFCGGNNTCVAEPTGLNAGAITVTGLGADPLSIARIASRNTYYTTLSDPYPPFSPGTVVTLSAEGADVGAFSLEGRGIAPLDFPGTGIVIKRDKALDLTWTAPAQPALSKIFVHVDIGHHGGIAAVIECHVDDTGHAQIAAALVNQLLDKGTAGFPSVSLMRRTVDSTTVGTGCVDFAVVSSVERIVMVEGVTSCTNVGSSAECPSGQTCGADLKCS